jgi:hypothetical protein
VVGSETSSISSSLSSEVLESEESLEDEDEDEEEDFFYFSFFSFFSVLAASPEVAGFPTGGSEVLFFGEFREEVLVLAGDIFGGGSVGF